MPKLEAFYVDSGSYTSFRTGLPILPPDDFVLGVTKPDEFNSGLVTTTGLTTISVDTEYGTAYNGQTISNTIFNGLVRVSGINIGFLNCWFRGRNSAGLNYVCRCNDNSGTRFQSGAYFERCLFESQYYHPTDADQGATGGLMGHKYTAYRCEFFGTCDGLGMSNTAGGISQDVNIIGSYVHDLYFQSPSTGHPTDGSHVDAFQTHGGTMNNVLVQGSNLVGLCKAGIGNSQLEFPAVTSGPNLLSGNREYNNSFSLWNGIYPNPPWATTTAAVLAGGTSINNYRIIDGWLDGGSYACVNLQPGLTSANSSAVEVSGNRIGANTRDKLSGRSYVVIRGAGLASVLTVSGNTNENDGTPNNLVRNG